MANLPISSNSRCCFDEAALEDLLKGPPPKLIHGQNRSDLDDEEGDDEWTRADKTRCRLEGC